MAHDFFRDLNTERPEYLNEEKDSDKFTAKDMIQEEPDLFKAMDEEPKSEEAVPMQNTEEPKAEAKTEEEQTQQAIDDKEEEIKEMVEDGASQEEVKEAIKELKALYGETEYKIPAEAKFRHKVDGEEVEVGLQDLLNNYSGKQSWDKKFTELDSERKAYKQDLDVVNKYINEFAEVSKNDKVEGLIQLAKAVGIDPLEYKKQLRQDLLSKYGEYLQMDEQQRSMFEQQEELDYLRQQRESELRMRQQQQAQAELQQKYSQVQETYGIDEERLNYLADELQNVHKVDVTPESVTELHLAMTRLDRVDNALKHVNESFLDDDSKVLQLESLLRGNPQMSDDELKNYAVKLWGNDVEKAVANLEKKVEKKKVPEAQKKPHNYSPKLNHVGNNINFFD